MNTYQILTFTLLLTATPLSPAQTEEKKENSVGSNIRNQKLFTR